MDTQYDEYQQELGKVQDKDFIYNWVSSSAFIFYLSVFCLVAFLLGSCLKLYSKRFENSRPDKITIQESTLYTPKYSTPK
jgi:DNA-binding transcriptional regulator of glucitol operon